MIWLLATILTLVTPIVGGTSFICAADRILPQERFKIAHRLICVAAEAMFLSSPCWILFAFGFLSLPTCCWITFGGILFFAIVMVLHGGNDFESFVMVAMMMIMIPQLAISIGEARDAYKRNHAEQSTELESP